MKTSPTLNMIINKLSAMIEENFFILHVANGIHIIIHIFDREQPMPTVEKLITRELYKNYGPMKTLDDLDLTLLTGVRETRKKDIHHSSDEDE